jgi:hypothetical protein
MQKNGGEFWRKVNSQQSTVNTKDVLIYKQPATFSLYLSAKQESYE